MRRNPAGARFAFLIVAAVLGLAASGCATARPVPETGSIVIRPGDEFLWQERQYRLVAVQEDFIVLRYVEPEGARGEISGWVREVFRVNRYELEEGRWYPRPELDGLAVMWRGGDDFALSATAGAGSDAPAGTLEEVK